ncbi:MAG: NAD-dependent epimerase/dehydratase family protein [Clostridium sp.]
MEKKILVMGGSYFIGKKIVDIMVKNNYSVYTLNRGTIEELNPKVTNIKCDRNDHKKMNSVLQYYNFDIVVDVSGLDKLQAEILFNSLNKDTIKKFIYISSSAVYDVENFETPYSEETPVKVNKHWTSYAANKIEAEAYLEDKLKETEIDLVILRPSYVYGENNYAQRESFIFEHIVNDKPIIIPSDGGTYLQFIYTSDLANIVLKLINSKLHKVSIFNVGNKKPVTIKEWIQHCENVVCKKANIVEYDYVKGNRLERDFFPFYDYNNVIKVDKINELYHIETNFEEGLKTCYKWYCDNKEKIEFKANVSENEESIIKELQNI